MPLYTFLLRLSLSHLSVRSSLAFSLSSLNKEAKIRKNPKSPEMSISETLAGISLFFYLNKQIVADVFQK